MRFMALLDRRDPRYDSAWSGARSIVSPGGVTPPGHELPTSPLLRDPSWADRPLRGPQGRPSSNLGSGTRIRNRGGGYDRAMNNRQQQGLLMVVFGVAIILVVAAVVALILGWIKL